jgi:hypothetical protein
VYSYYGENDYARKFVFCGGEKKNFGWMNVWELNPEGMISLWLKAFAT